MCRYGTVLVNSRRRKVHGQSGTPSQGRWEPTELVYRLEAENVSVQLVRHKIRILEDLVQFFKVVTDALACAHIIVLYFPFLS